VYSDRRFLLINAFREVVRDILDFTSRYSVSRGGLEEEQQDGTHPSVLAFSIHELLPRFQGNRKIEI
jgi:hypothetical protein